MKAKELVNLSIEELQDKFKQTQGEYRVLKMKSKTSSIENPIQIRILRRSVARIATILTKKSSN